MSSSPKTIRIVAENSKPGEFFSEPMGQSIRIVVGERGEKRIDLPRLPNLSRVAPELKELILRNVAAIQAVRQLPGSLIALEILGAPDLEKIELPACSLFRLTLIDCPKLSAIEFPDGTEWQEMEELILRGCSSLPSNVISALVGAAPNLLELDLSRCQQSNPLVGRLPTRLERLRLDGCSRQEQLPSGLPADLRYLSLQNCTGLKSIPKLPESCDYCDLSGTRQLRTLPVFPRSNSNQASMEERLPRSLFLCGSGILEPPAFEHGRTPQTNVAAITHAYRNDCELAGKGNALRCKLLLLGNSTAGKTEFAHQLLAIPRKSRDSTHGVQLFTDPKFQAGVDHVHLHVWDFGGQEIYHNTHRHFASRGSVFVILWDPDQDVKQPGEGASGLQDRYYPVRYWLDYIVSACPHLSPSIAIVCNVKDPNLALDAPWKERMRERLAKQVGDTYWEQIAQKQIGFFCADVQRQRGDWRELTKEWLSNSVRSVLDDQGFVVPSYWELAQEMVKSWLPGNQVSVTSGTQSGMTAKTMTMSEFSGRLATYASSRLSGVPSARHADENIADRALDLCALKDAWNGGAFLTPDRVERTLRFLTHLGWIYWDPALHEAQIIIDQRWALDAIYETLRHDPVVGMYCQLKSADGVLDYDMVLEHVWRHWPTESEQTFRLLWSFMQAVGVLIPLKHRWSGDEKGPQFLSPEHLPETGPAYMQFLQEHFSSISPNSDGVAESMQLHRGHWLDTVRVFAANHGLDAQYTQHAVWLRGEDRARGTSEEKEWQAWLQFEPVDYASPKPSPARIVAHYVACDEEHRKQIEELVRSQCPGYAGNASDQIERYRTMVGERAPKGPTVFISYSHDPATKPGYYTEPVNAVCNVLKSYEKQRQCSVIRDSTSMEENGSIMRFIDNGINIQADHYLVFLNEKYWTGWYTMLELLWIRDSFLKSTKNAKDSLSWIAHPERRIGKAADAEWFKEWWKKRADACDQNTIPGDMPGPIQKLDWRLLPKQFLEVIHWYVTEVRETIDVTKPWPIEPLGATDAELEKIQAEREGIFEWVRKRLKLDASEEDQ